MVVLSKNWELTGFLDQAIVRGAFGYLWRRPDGVIMRLHVGKATVRTWRKYYARLSLSGRDGSLS